ncbi:MAG: TIGR00282 family metallophosphoesterase [Patescibacteria group bacterium]
MKIIFFGDVVGQPGRQALKKIIPQWRKKYQPDLTLANGDNLAHGKGVTENSLKELLDMSIDLITSGDHIWSKKEQAFALLEKKEIPLIRPANMSTNLPGQGYRIIKLRTKKILVINLIGQTFMKETYDNPFKKADQILDEQEDKADIIIVDWHAEATSEKICLGWYLDGRVTAVLGTHTHIPTADEQILPQGTAYISDIGMVGPKNSSLGADKELSIKHFLKETPFKYKIASGSVEVNAVLIETDKNNRGKKITRLRKIIEL